MYCEEERMILEKLYKGKIYPGEKSVPITRERYRMEAVFADRCQSLMEKLDESKKDEYMDILEEANAISAYDCEQAYIAGMRMGAQLMAEMLFSGEPD